MRVVNVHVGHFKTGTSSFQHRLSELREELTRYGVLYPLGNEAHPTQQGAALGSFTKFGKREAIDNILQEFRASEADTLVLSGEVLSNSSASSVAELVARLKSDGFVRLVYAIRDWSSYLPSRYAQNSRRADGWTWWEYLEATVRTFDHNVDVNFALNINAFALAGADDFQLLYHRDGRAIKDLLGAMELTSRVGSVVLQGSDEPTRNRAGDPDLLEATRLVNALHAELTGESANRLFDARLKQDTLSATYGLSAVAKAVLNDRGFSEQLRREINARRETPEFLTRQTLSQWINSLTRSIEQYGLRQPPASWGSSQLPQAFQPSRLTVKGLTEEVRNRLVRELEEHFTPRLKG